MPMRIDFIDAIARKKGRDVLFLQFPPEGGEDEFFPKEVDWVNLPIRKQIIAWLEQSKISWLPCGDFADENCMLSYRGQIYIDVPFDVENPIYQHLQNYLENPDGSGKFPGARFCYLPLQTAMKNVHHDEPGFWERWAENF